MHKKAYSQLNIHALSHAPRLQQMLLTRMIILNSIARMWTHQLNPFQIIMAHFFIQKNGEPDSDPWAILRCSHWTSNKCSNLKPSCQINAPKLWHTHMADYTYPFTETFTERKYTCSGLLQIMALHIIIHGTQIHVSRSACLLAQYCGYSLRTFTWREYTLAAPSSETFTEHKYTCSGLHAGSHYNCSSHRHARNANTCHLNRMLAQQNIVET
jgi:hypothetical protein